MRPCFRPDREEQGSSSARPAPAPSREHHHPFLRCCNDGARSVPATRPPGENAAWQGHPRQSCHPLESAWRQPVSRLAGVARTPSHAHTARRGAFSHPAGGGVFINTRRSTGVVPPPPFANATVPTGSLRAYAGGPASEASANDGRRSLSFSVPDVVLRVLPPSLAVAHRPWRVAASLVVFARYICGWTAIAVT